MENREPIETNQMGNNADHTPFTNISNTIIRGYENGSNSLGPNVDAKECKRQMENERYATMSVEHKNEKSKKRREIFLWNTYHTPYSAQDVVVVATRRIMRPTKKGSTVQRPRTRTLTPVHDGILEDVVFPVEIMRKRVRYPRWCQGHREIFWIQFMVWLISCCKIFLDLKERNNIEYKLETYTPVYHSLCGKDVVFEYPMIDIA
ncbi:40S ribosomal protein S7-2 [Zea mays]|uniref:40S ribosomal protein S7 n=1 Tax=Zea mays TaxID=4577 RepID=A0A1D6QP28_MAIZE|nr:40S ribosomal protein S7-2 [Zea mays]